MLYKCKNCGGNVVFDPKTQHMHCLHCESEESQEIKKESSIQKCVNCGAPLEIDDLTSACKCGYCGVYHVFEERLDGDYEPHLILPFKISKRQAVEALEKEFKKRVFTPTGFLSAKSLESMEGRYVPFWLYDFDTEYNFVGEGTKVRTWTAGDIEYTETSYYEVVRDLDIDFKKIPVDASEKMDDSVMDLMEPYNYEGLQNFEPKYMSGFLGEIYNYKADEVIKRAKNKAKEASDQLMDKTISGYATVRERNRNLRIDERDKNYALFPVWVYVYRFNDKNYEFHVNGQTGKVIGITPVQKNKVIGYGATIFVALTMILFFLVGIVGVV